jgi:hypothetical protein
MTAEPDSDPDPVGPWASVGVERVIGEVGSVVNSAQGPVAAGSGNQNNYYWPPDTRQPVRRDPLLLSDKQERDLEPRFVEPPGWERARKVLASFWIVLLQGEPGIGRRSAALRLLGMHHSLSGGPIRVLSWQPDESGGRCLDPQDVEEGDRLLLDLSEVGDQRFREVQRELEEFRSTLHEQKAFLVVVLPAHQVREELLTLVVTVGRPNGRQVWHAHLAAEDVSYPPAETEQARLAAVLHSGSMREIARLAWLVREARDTGGWATFAEWLDQALTAQAERAKEVASKVRDHPDVPYRALLLATAMCAEFPADAVFEAERLLLEKMRYELGQTHELERPDLGTRLDGINAEIGVAGQVRFTSLNYAAAVRTHFWTNFPSLRDDFRDWVAACGGMTGLIDADRDELVTRFAEQCLRVGQPNDLISVTETWTTRVRTVRLAEKALECGLTNPRWGSRLRGQLYDWSRKRGLSPQLAGVVIDSCARVIAPNQPSPAMVRLHHLTRHSDDEVSHLAEDALVELASSDHFLCRLLARLTDEECWRLREPHNRHLFLRVADPTRLIDAESRSRPLIADRVVRAQLVAAWRSVLTMSRAKKEYEDTIYLWLRAQAKEPHNDALLTVLVESCDGTIKPLASLYATGRRWLRHTGEEPGGAARSATVLRLEDAIDRVRGVHQCPIHS